jgi:nicotinamide mononucleotide adenylyltransferase
MNKLLLKSAVAPDPEGWAMVVGRFRPFDSSHRRVIDRILEQGSRVLICVTDHPQDQELVAEEVAGQIRRVMWPEVGKDRVRVIVIPDIGSVNVVPESGYDIVEWVPAAE